MKTILATAYAVNPNNGSEDGMGWNYILQIAKFHRVIAITRENNQDAIEAYMQQNPDERYERIQFLYFDCPYWMRFWKKGSRGAMLYFLLWQKRVVRFIKKQDLAFDIIHNLNFHNDWTPSWLWQVKKPFVWGPIGHHPKIPAQYLKPYTKKYLIKDRLTWWVKNYFWKFSGALRKTIQQADHVMVMNSGVTNHISLKGNFSINSSVATQDFGWKADYSNTQQFTIISAGRFVPLKGFDLTLNAFAKFLQKLSAEEKAICKLMIVGKGPEEETLKNLATELDIRAYVDFIPWMERTELMETMKNADAFLFPSHEGAGMVVAEALSFGLPVICLQNEGPGEFIDETCGLAVPMDTYEKTIQELGEQVYKLYAEENLKQILRRGARKMFEKRFHWDRKGELLQTIYKTL